MDIVEPMGRATRGSIKCRGSPPPEFRKPMLQRRGYRTCSLADVRVANGTLGSLFAKSRHSIVAIKPSLIFLLFSQTKQHVSVLHGVSCVAPGL